MPRGSRHGHEPFISWVIFCHGDLWFFMQLHIEVTMTVSLSINNHFMIYKFELLNCRFKVESDDEDVIMLMITTAIMMVMVMVDMMMMVIMLMMMIILLMMMMTMIMMMVTITSLSLQCTAQVKLCVRFPVITFTN